MLGDTAKVAVGAVWLVDVGDNVEVGTPLMSVETDEMTTDVLSPVAGTLAEPLVGEQDEIPIGAPIARIQG